MNGQQAKAAKLVIHETGNWYERPSWYDILHAPTTADELDAIERIARDIGVGGTSSGRTVWYEPACGTGRLLRLACARGGVVVGTDELQAMVAYAQGWFDRRGYGTARARLEVAGMDADLSGLAADVSLCTINTIRHLLSDEAILTHLKSMRHNLARNGIYIVGIGLTDPAADDTTEDIWCGRRGRCEVTQVVQYLPGQGKDGRLERVVSHLMAVTPTCEHHLDSVYDLRMYTLKQWLDLIQASELDVLRVCDAWGRTAGDSLEEQLAFALGEGIQHGYAHWILGIGRPNQPPIT